MSDMQTKKIGTITLALMVLAMAAPVGVVVGLSPLVIGYGDGIGAPGMFVLVALVLVVFSFGFAAMATAVPTRGAFFAFIQAGLGKRLGMAAGFVAYGSYSILTIYVGAQLGYFAHNFFAQDLHVEISWIVFALVFLALVGLLTRRGTRESALVTAGLLAVELVILLVLNIGVLISRGPASYPLQSFSPREIFSGSPGFAVALVFLAFIGFEVTAVFTDHVKNPRKTVGRATLVAVILIAVVYSLSTWSGIAGIGIDAVVKLAQGSDAGLLMPNLADDVVGPWAGPTLQVILITSTIATMIAVFNTTSHYLFNLTSTAARPNLFGRLHPKFETPANAGVAQFAFTGLVLFLCWVARLDPYVQVSSLLGALGSVGVIMLEVACALAIFVYFRRSRDKRVWTTMISPLVACIALFACLVYVLVYYGAISGATFAVGAWSPLIFLVLAIAGWIVGGRGKALAPLAVQAAEAEASTVDA